jgi:very-short-patch-repair endonuclease/predicted transcriptional regulator of viral defense system
MAREVADTIWRRIAAVAAPQHGVITRRQLLLLGVGADAIVYWVATGRLHTLHRGVYAVGHLPVSPHAHAMAAVLACGDGAALSHRSAAALWGIDREWPDQLEVTARSARRRPKLVIHRSSTLTHRDVTEHFGISVTSPERTVLDNANRLGDRRLARTINDLRLAGHLSLGRLAELLDRHPPNAATKRLKPQVAKPERAPTRSEFEDAFLLFADRYDLPELRVNTRVVGHEADIFFPDHRLVVELDGYEFHSPRDQFESDRDRDADLLAAGIATVRITWERLTWKPSREAARLNAILEERGSDLTPPPVRRGTRSSRRSRPRRRSRSDGS